MIIGWEYAGGAITLDDIDFYTEWYSFSAMKSITIRKQECRRSDDGTWFAFVDTSKVGPGRLKMCIHAFIPDADYPGGKREQIDSCESDVIIHTKM